MGHQGQGIGFTVHQCCAGDSRGGGPDSCGTDKTLAASYRVAQVLEAQLNHALGEKK